MGRSRPTPRATPPRNADPYRDLGAGAAQDAEEAEALARRRARRARTVLPFFLASAAVITVGAAAYSRNVLSHDEPADRVSAARAISPSDESRAMRRDLRRSDETERGRGQDALLAKAVSARASVGPTAAPVSGSLVRDAAGNYPGVQIEIGHLNVTRDPTGILQTSLPLRVTNIGYVPRSFDIRVTARGPKGAKITDDTGTVLDLRPGQSAEVRVLDLVNNAIAEDLQQASFDVTDVFAY